MSAFDCDACEDTGEIVSPMGLGTLQPCPNCNRIVTTCWLIEWPAAEFVATRWWNPASGWEVEPHRATRFCRHVDAQNVIDTSKFCNPVIATEHVFLQGVQS